MVLIRKKLKNDEAKRKYHIIRKIHAFHVFPKTEYLTRSMALFCCKNWTRELMRTKTLFFSALKKKCIKLSEWVHKTHKLEGLTLSLNSHSLHGTILWIRRNWKVCILVSMTMLKGILKSFSKRFYLCSRLYSPGVQTYFAIALPCLNLSYPEISAANHGYIIPLLILYAVWGSPAESPTTHEQISYTWSILLCLRQNHALYLSKLI